MILGLFMCKTRGLFQCHGVGGRAIIITNVKGSVESGKLI